MITWMNDVRDAVDLNMDEFENEIDVEEIFRE
jgi:hypothetical protein